MRDGEDLSGLAKRDQAFANGGRDRATDALVGLIEDQSERRSCLGERTFQGQGHTGKLPAGSDLSQGAKTGARIGFGIELDPVDPVRAALTLCQGRDRDANDRAAQLQRLQFPRNRLFELRRRSLTGCTQLPSGLMPIGAGGGFGAAGRLERVLARFNQVEPITQ